MVGFESQNWTGVFIEGWKSDSIENFANKVIFLLPTFKKSGKHFNSRFNCQYENSFYQPTYPMLLFAPF